MSEKRVIILEKEKETKNTIQRNRDRKISISYGNGIHTERDV